jgi:hypothetical protein
MNDLPESTVPPARDAELAARGLPEFAFVDNTKGLAACKTAVVAVRRGEAGCYEVRTEMTADALNAQIGVSEAQREAMLAGSMFGWDCKASFPWTYERRIGKREPGREH